MNYKDFENSKNWKDCPSCKKEKTLGKLITEEWYCWNCNYKEKPKTP